jgi:hypothetical protein
LGPAATAPPIDLNTLSRQVRDRQRERPFAKRTSKVGTLVLLNGPWTLHDLRRTAATPMGDLGCEGRGDRAVSQPRGPQSDSTDLSAPGAPRGATGCLRAAECLPREHRPPLGDFCQKSYQLARLFARLLCCAKGYIARLCAPLRALQADEDPAQSGNCSSSIRLRSPPPTPYRRPVVADVLAQGTISLSSLIEHGTYKNSRSLECAALGRNSETPAAPRQR